MSTKPLLNLNAYTPVLTIDEAMAEAQACAADAYHGVRDAGGSEEEANVAASEGYRNALPLLKSKGNIQAFIATVADGVATKHLSANEGRVLLYAAKLAIAVHLEAR